MIAPVVRTNETASLAADVGALQRHASDPTWSIWVGASAGSGKTKVLADRVTRLLLAGVSPQRILCLTFTRAAAAEMAIRLTQRLSGWATCAEEALDKELVSLEGETFNPALRDRARRLFAQVLSCPGGMRFQTIHAFAQEILRRFPLEAGLVPHFTVMEEFEANALWQEALDAVFENAAEGAESESAGALDILVRAMGEGSLRALLREVSGQAQKIKTAIHIEHDFSGLMGAVREALGLGEGEDGAFFRKDATAEENFARAALKKAALLVKEKGTKIYTARADKILHWLEQDEEGRAIWFDDYLSAFMKKELVPFKDLANKKIITDYPEVEETLRAEATRLQSVIERMETAQTAQETQAVLILALRVAELYAARKTAIASLDYDDLIAKTNAVLSRPDIAPWVLYKLDGGIDHMLVDESQDTNPEAWRIIGTLADEYFSGETARSDRLRTLFVVGDEKQSIYSFLKADPEAFAQMREHFATQIRAADQPFDEVPLNVSFRSTPAVLRAVDAVFAADSVRAGVSRDPVQHRAFREQGAGRVEVWPLLVTPDDQKADDKKRVQAATDWALPIGYETAHDPAAELARSVAAKIKGWLDDGVTIYDREIKAERPMGAGDVMVLVQTRGAFVEHLVRELKAASVPVSGVDRMFLTQQLAVMDMVALLQFALLPEDDLTLATVLRGPLMGASEDELMALAIGRDGSLWHSLQQAARRGEKKAIVWRDYLQSVAAMADQKPPLQMLVRLLTSPCPADAVSGRRALWTRLGPEAEDPLDELLGAAEAFGTRHSPSLQAFLHALLSSEAQIKRELEQAAGRVRITTVHASKGLEAPVVILPDTVHVPQKIKLSKVLWGEGLPFYVPRDPKNARLAALRGAALDKQMEEYRRLLYVALTRAADRLVVCGFKTERADRIEHSWYSLIAAALKPHHQEEALPETEGDLVPEIVLADYALRPAPSARASERAVSLSNVAKALPPWLFAPPPPEPSPPRPFVPSRPSEEEPPSLSPRDARFKRGRLIHRLLQSLPDVEESKREAAAKRFLANPQSDLAPDEQDEIAQEVLRLLQDEHYAPLFAPESRAEVPIIGLVGERLISGQVDRLALVGDDVWIVDYKTNRPPPVADSGVPPAYRTQMEAYRAVLAEIYPANTIRCFLLWTYAPRLMEILPSS